MKTQLNIKVDKKTREDAKKLAKEMGLTLSSVINASLKQFVNDKELKLSRVPRISSDLEKTIQKAEQDLKKGNIVGPLTSSKEIDDMLDNA